MTTGQEIPAVPAPSRAADSVAPPSLRRAMQHGRRIAVTLLLDWIMTAFMIYVFVGGQLFEDRSQESLALNFAKPGPGRHVPPDLLFHHLHHRRLHNLPP